MMPSHRTAVRGQTPRAGRAPSVQKRSRVIPPNGVDFLVFWMFWKPQFLFTRLGSILKGERSMSIGR